MGDCNDLVKTIKKAAVEATEETKPTAFVFGTVVLANPLTINVEQKLTLTTEQLILSRNVTDYYVAMTVDHETQMALTSEDLIHTHAIDINTSSSDGHSHSVTGSAEENEAIDISHKHAYSGTKLFLVHNALAQDEIVILARVQGGQKYIVLDRVGEAV